MTKVDGRSAVPIDILVGYHYGVEVLIIDTLDGEVDITRQLGIER